MHAQVLYMTCGNSGDYSNNVNSIVTIAPNGANQITLTFSEFGIEAPSSSNNCNFDYVEIFDGPTLILPHLVSTVTH